MPKTPSLLSQKAMLADLTVSKWTARRYDATVSEETNRRNNAASDAGRYNKLLIHKLDIASINRIKTEAQQRHYTLTQPWLDNGNRLLPAALYMDYAAEMRQLKAAYDNASDAFERNYPNIVARARVRLNGMFREEDYPSQREIRNKFGFDIKVMPCPDASDFRVNIAQEHLASMQQDVEHRIKQALDNAMRDTKERIATLVGHMAEKLKSYKPGDEDNRAEGTFRGSLVGNLRELVALLPSFNLTDDLVLTALTKRIEQELCANDADVLREHEDVRAAVAIAADKILTDVAAFMA